MVCKTNKNLVINKLEKDIAWKGQCKERTMQGKDNVRKENARKGIAFPCIVFLYIAIGPE